MNHYKFDFDVTSLGSSKELPERSSSPTRGTNENISLTNIAIIEYNQLVNSYITSKNDLYQNIQLKPVRVFKQWPTGCPGKRRKQCYAIKCQNFIYKHGFRNIRCQQQHAIDSVKLYLCEHGTENDCTDGFGGAKCISDIYNPDGIIFDKLRKIYGIDDPTIIPIITEKFMPYLENYFYRLLITYNDSADLDNLDDIELSYEIVEMDTECFTPFQFKTDINRIININKHFKDIQQIIPELEYVTPRIQYCGTESIINNKSSFVTLYNGHIQKILMYTPNKSIIGCKCRIILDQNEELQVPIHMHSEGKFVVISFNPEDNNDSAAISKYSINYDLLCITGIRIDIEFATNSENGAIDDIADVVEVFGICNFVYKITNGCFGELKCNGKELRMKF
ncbi:MAG: hypothetical protein H0U27_01285 [Nitrosopumilus sp.]|nr:hypothetical protein [Nitrosopumilus sp.]